MDEFAYTFWGRLTELVNDLFDYISERQLSIVLFVIGFILIGYVSLKFKISSFEFKSTPKTKEKILRLAYIVFGIGIVLLLFF